MDITALAHDLQSQELGRRINALLQLLHETCIGQEVGPLVSLACNKVVAQPNTVPVKKLGYELVRTATLSVSDWDAVAAGLKTDVSNTQYDEIQIAALQTISTVPSWKMSELLVPPCSLGDDVATCLNSTSRVVRRMAIEALTHFVTSAAMLQTIQEQSVLRSSVLTWAEFVGDHLLDESDTVVVTSHSCIGRILNTTFPPAEGDTERQELHSRIKGLLCTRILKALTVILDRTQGFPPAAAIEVCELLTAVTTTLLCASNSQALAFAMEEYGWKGRGFYHEAVVNEVSTHLGQYLSATDFDPALALSACRSTLDLTGVVTREIGTVGWAIQKQWAPLAVKTLIKLSVHNAHRDTRVDLAQLTAQHLGVLSPADQYTAIRTMLPVVLGIHTEWDRCSCMSAMWTVIADADIRNRVRQIRGSRGSAAVDMNKVLEDGLIRELITGVTAGGAEGSSQFAQFPQFREEVVGTLLATCLHHPDAQVARLQKLFPDAMNPEVMPGNVEDMMDTLFGALAWLGLARVALVNTKSCLGWEREGAAQSEAIVTNAAVDLYLQLLQHSFYVAAEVRRAGSQVQFEQEDEEEVFRQKSKAQLQDGAGDKLEDKFAEMVNHYADAYQLLLRQVIVNWRVLSPVVKARALLVGGQHMLLAPQTDDNWRSLLAACTAALNSSGGSGSGRVAAAKAVEAGTMAYDNADPMDTTDVVRFQAANEMAEVGVQTLEYLSSLLLKLRPPPPPGNQPFTEGDLIPKGYKDISATVVTLAREASKNHKLDAASRERCHLLVQRLSPLASLPVNPAVPEVPVEELASLKPINARVALQPGGFPLGPAIGTALFRSRREVRYRQLEHAVYETVQQARRFQPQAAPLTADEPSFADLMFAEPAPAEEDTSSFLDDLLQGVGIGEVVGQELSGVGDAVQLSAWHEFDSRGQQLTMHFRLRNRLAAPLTDLAVRLWLTGSLSANVRGSFVYRPSVLEAGESVQWSMDFSICAFGRFVLQPSIGFGSKARQGIGMRCKAYEIPATQLLLPAAKDVYGGDVLFQYWAGLPFSTSLDAVSTLPGPEAGLYVMSALQSHAYSTMVLGSTVPVAGGFEAAALGLTRDGAMVGIVINGALDPKGETAKSEGRVVCSVTIRSSSATAVAAFDEGASSWLADITAGLLRPAKEFSGGNVVSDAKFVPLVNPKLASNSMYSTHGVEQLSAAVGTMTVNDEDFFKSSSKQPAPPPVSSAGLPTPLEQWKALRKVTAVV